MRDKYTILSIQSYKLCLSKIQSCLTCKKNCSLLLYILYTLKASESPGRMSRVDFPGTGTGAGVGVGVGPELGGVLPISLIGERNRRGGIKG
jgi:hypothetical protein